MTTILAYKLDTGSEKLAATTAACTILHTTNDGNKLFFYCQTLIVKTLLQKLCLRFSRCARISREISSRRITSSPPNSLKRVRPRRVFITKLLQETAMSCFSCCAMANWMIKIHEAEIILVTNICTTFPSMLIHAYVWGLKFSTKKMNIQLFV